MQADSVLAAQRSCAPKKLPRGVPNFDNRAQAHFKSISGRLTLHLCEIPPRKADIESFSPHGDLP
jgi:hypothetical protein